MTSADAVILTQRRGQHFPGCGPPEDRPLDPPLATRWGSSPRLHSSFADDAAEAQG